jgi:acid phosphatase
MTQSFAVTHPSEPNYLALFSGATQGLTSDACPQTYTAPNVASALIAAHHSFVGYSEGLPSVGYLGCSSGEYARKHNPWSDFSAVPAADNQPFSSFPTSYSQLPALSFVIPNLLDDMHDGTIGAGDAWLKEHLSGYVTWARANNSALILTWDEDDHSQNNQIPTIIIGAHVKVGRYSEHVDHYRMQRTLEYLFGVTPTPKNSTVSPITDIWN